MPTQSYGRQRTEVRELQREEVLRNEERRLKLGDKAPEKAHGEGLTGWVSWVEVDEINESISISSRI